MIPNLNSFKKLQHWLDMRLVAFTFRISLWKVLPNRLNEAPIVWNTLTTLRCCQSWNLSTKHLFSLFYLADLIKMFPTFLPIVHAETLKLASCYSWISSALVATKSCSWILSRHWSFKETELLPLMIILLMVDLALILLAVIFLPVKHSEDSLCILGGNKGFQAPLHFKYPFFSFSVWLDI